MVFGILSEQIKIDEKNFRNQGVEHLHNKRKLKVFYTLLRMKSKENISLTFNF